MLRLVWTVLLIWFAIELAHPAQAETNVLFIFDSSGSMKKPVETGESRSEAAKKAMADALGQIPADTRLGLMLYGHRRSKDCTDIELVSPIGADSAATIAGIIEAAEPKGETPIADTLQKAARSFAALKGQSNSIVLVTDGIEECGGDPCAAARAIKDAGFDLKVHIVGFTLSDEQRQTVQCIVDETGGTYFGPQDSTALVTALREVIAPTPPQPPPQPVAFNLLHRDNGGHLIAAPFREWERVIEQPEDYVIPDLLAYASALPSEAIFAFKDERSATFDKFAMLIPQSLNKNPKTFEIFAGDDLSGEFRSLGQFTTQNLLMIKTPYQEFKLPETTAKYLKVKMIDTHGASPLYLYPMKLFGKLAEAVPDSVSPAPESSGEQINLLSAANGASLLAAPFREWQRVIEQPEDYVKLDLLAYASALPSEAIFAFKDERSATFDKFAMLIPQSLNKNPKTFEIFAGDDLSGEFRSLGQFTTQNLLMIKTPYQEFKLPETTAKYLKVKMIDTHGASPLYLYPMKLFGKLAEAVPDSVSPAPESSGEQINLLSAANGASLLAAPFREWQRVIEQPEDYVKLDLLAYASALPSEAIFAFKDERSATFDKFAMLIPQSLNKNPKTFEIFAGDDLSGEFRSLGQFTTQNLLMIKTPYQEFKLPETTAKYLKVKMIDTHGASPLYLYPIKLFGKPMD